jgi:hypothetical protein
MNNRTVKFIDVLEAERQGNEGPEVGQCADKQAASTIAHILEMRLNIINMSRSCHLPRYIHTVAGSSEKTWKMKMPRKGR